MTSKRTSARTRLLLSAASVAVAALSLTACNDGSGVKDEGASAAPAGSSTATPAATPSTQTQPPASASDAKPGEGIAEGEKTSSGGGGGSKGGTGGTGSTGGTAAAKAVTCDATNTKTVAAPLTRPVNHMLLTVTNTGSSRCYLYNYPALRFTAAQAVPPVIEESKPQAVVTLNPGESGYASVNLSATDGSGSHGYTAKDLTVLFQNRGGSFLDRGATPSLPAKGVYIDDSLKVTYWQQSMNDAVSY